MFLKRGEFIGASIPQHLFQVSQTCKECQQPAELTILITGAWGTYRKISVCKFHWEQTKKQNNGNEIESLKIAAAQKPEPSRHKADSVVPWHKKNPHTRFVFGTSSDLPNGHFLETVKRTAYRAKLNCGKCSSCIERNECEHWDLKTFRSTLATWALQRGVDVRTVQALMGHTKTDMTAKYLAPLKGKAAQEKLNSVFANVKGSKGGRGAEIG